MSTKDLELEKFWSEELREILEEQNAMELKAIGAEAEGFKITRRLNFLNSLDMLLEAKELTLTDKLTIIEKVEWTLPEGV